MNGLLRCFSSATCGISFCLRILRKINRPGPPSPADQLRAAEQLRSDNQIMQQAGRDWDVAQTEEDRRDACARHLEWMSKARARR